jgi:tetratricopeptide (TPR) repeat protein
MTFESELQAALAFVDRGDNEGALRSFEKISRRNLSPYEECVILLNEKKCLELLGRFKEARTRLKAIERIDSSAQFHLYLELGYIHILFAEGKLREAIERGKAFLLKNDEELRQKEYEDVVYDLRLRIACDLLSSGQLAQAIAALQRFLPHSREDDQPRVHLFLGIAYEQLGQPENAESEFKQVLRWNRAQGLVADAHYHLGANYLKKGAPAWAKQHFLAAEDLKHALPDNIPLRDLYTFLADSCGHLGEGEQRKHYLQLAAGS